MSKRALQRLYGGPAPQGRAVGRDCARRPERGVPKYKWLIVLALAAMVAPCAAQEKPSVWGARAAAQSANRPPRVVAAERFLAQRGWRSGGSRPWAGAGRFGGRSAAVQSRALAVPLATGAGTANWQPLGPTAVQSQSYGLVTGRISALALDPSDGTGNTLYVGTTGGGVWRSQNADTSNTANISFAPLTDDLPALIGALDASISIGALTVQPGGTGVILAGTGDPNDALDSYYGAGILRSTDGGTTWSLIQTTSVAARPVYSFAGEGFAGFAWSTVNPQLVVAAVSQAYEGTLVNAIGAGAGSSYEGLYYSPDSGATWYLATITDGVEKYVQGPSEPFVLPDGNAATSVVWNAVRQMFVAAVRFHGYYQSADGVNWTRMTNQPGANLLTGAGFCPTNIGQTGSPDCPIYRGTLAVNPATGDTFAWTVDINNQDQGIWQDLCVASASACTNQTITFAQQWGTAALETNVPDQGPATIVNGDYNLALAAIPSSQETIVLAGANDLWKSDCPYSQGCQWRNTTNSTVGFCAQVGEYQHSLAWNTSNPLEIFAGNDSGLWRSTDAINESGSVCSASDATHFQNLNGSLGSLAEVESLSQTGATPYTMMAGLGTNGAAGVKSSSGATADWPEILGGEGGPVAIDPNNSANWYVNNEAGVSIYLCSQTAPCTPGSFNAVLDFTTDPGSFTTNQADVVRDGLSMAEEPPYAPAAFVVDPLESSQLLIATCRVWRGPADGVGWSASNAISPILDGILGDNDCSGNALIRSLAAMSLAASTTLPSGGEVVYAGMYGSGNGGATLPGHVLSATYNTATGNWSGWSDLTLNPVSNNVNPMNYYGLDISSISIDPHDPTGETVYVTVAGIPSPTETVEVVYRSIDGGEHWSAMMSNLPLSPANSIVVDPEDANTVYVATDDGVYSTRQIASCSSALAGCWSAFGIGLPNAPVVAISTAPAAENDQEIVAATYGRGIWMTPLWTAGESLTTASATPASLTFASQVYGTSSSTQTVTLKNTGTVALTPTYIAFSGAANGDYSESDNCQHESLAGGASCGIQVTFTPTATGSRTALMRIDANISGGDLTVSLSGTGSASGVVSLSPATIDFGSEQVNSTSAALQVTANNNSSSAVPFSSVINGPFNLASNSCGSSIPANNSCNLTVTFTPVEAGTATGTLTFTDSYGTQRVTLSGTGETPSTDALSPTSLTFLNTVVGQLSAAQTVTLTNNGGVELTSITVSASGAFQATNGCSTSLAADSSCAISVVYAPSQTGSQTGTLTVADSLHTQTVALSGTGVQAPVLGVSPTSMSFTGLQLGVATAPQTLTVSNTGGAPLANVGFQITGLSASSFSTGATNCGSTLASGGNCTVLVYFTPAAAGGSTASLAVSSSTSGVAAVNVALSGSYLSSTGLNVNPSQLAFPIVTPGQSSPPQTVTILNNGASTATSLTLTATPPFSLVQNACGASLAAGVSCSTGVIFSPSLDGPYTGTLTIASPSLTSAASVALSGTGGVPGTVQAQPSLIDFPQTGVALYSSPVTVTLTNPSGTMSLTSVTLAVTAGFRLVNNNCGTTLGAGASCTTGVEFAPTNAGAQTGSLTVSSSALTAGAFVPLSGVGFDFGLTPTGSSTQTIANGQTADFQLSITPLPGGQGVFSFQCGTLPPAATCAFNPASEGIPANTTGNVVVEIATGVTTTTAHSLPPLSWPVLPLACGVLLAPLALTRRRRALMLTALLMMLMGGVSSCTSSGVISGGTVPGGGGGTSTTPPATYSIPVTASSNGVSHSITLTLTVD